jgi:hypothetical protein
VVYDEVTIVFIYCFLEDDKVKGSQTQFYNPKNLVKDMLNSILNSSYPKKKDNIIDEI